MTTKVYYRKVPNGFIPADDYARQEFEELENNRVYRIQVSKPRSGRQHRLFMGLCAKIADNIDGATTQAMYTYIKGRLGHCDIVQLPNGDKVRNYKSIAFDKMPQDEFQNFMNDAVELICSELIPGLNNQELMDEVNNMLE